jgi:hypothetical protein
MGAEELRLRLYEMPPQLGGRIESAADRIRSDSSDPGVRRRALLWKAEGIPAVYVAALRPDPLAGGLDLWVLLYQMTFYFQDGAGKDSFGLQQSIATNAMTKTVAYAEEKVKSLYADPDVYEKRRDRVQAFARAHPIQDGFASRETAIRELAHLSVGESAGTLAAVGEATETLADVSLRLNAYVTLLPRLAVWQAELAASDVLGRESIGETLGDVHAIAGAARRADALLADIPGAARSASGPMRELLDQERADLLAAVDRERLSMSAFVTAEREAAFAAVSEERRAALENIDKERAAAIAGLDALARRSIVDASGSARSIVDRLFWRALILIAVAALLFGASYRIARGRGHSGRSD